MNEKHEVDVKPIRQMLNAYRETEAEIDGQIERLERLTSKISSAGVKPLSDMPRNPSASHDRFADYLVRKERLDASIRAAIKHQAEERERIERILKCVRKSNERLVIRTRYFDRESWNDVNDLLFGGKPDFLDKEDSYLRRTHQLHGQALLHMAEAASYMAEKETILRNFDSMVSDSLAEPAGIL